METTPNLVYQQTQQISAGDRRDFSMEYSAQFDDDSDIEEDEIGAPKPETPPRCCCLESSTFHDESIEGPYYSQLGVGPSVAALRRILEARTGHSGSAIRIEKLVWSGKEGRSKEGCPAAKYILRRSSPSEQILCLARHRLGHECFWSWQIIAIVCWEPIPAAFTDDLYNFLRSHLPSHGIMTERRCGTNEARTCACQGFNEAQQGAAYSFGCSWSMYHNACKFARGSRSLGLANNNNRSPRKFRLRGHKRGAEERELEHRMNNLADRVSGICSRLVPDAFNRQVLRDSVAFDCRLGSGNGIARPFAGVTACLDYCSHNHRENHNMEGSVTAVVTLLGKNRLHSHRSQSTAMASGPEEQYHVFPMYHVDRTDEFGTRGGQAIKEQNRSVHYLESFERLVRQRAYPLPSGHARRRQARAARSASVEVKSPTNSDSLCFTGNLPSDSFRSPPQNSPTEVGVSKVTAHRCTIRLPSIDSWFRKPFNCLPPAGCWCNDPSVANEHNALRKIAIPEDFSHAEKSQLSLSPLRDGGSVACDREYWSQTEDLFLNSDMGGVGIALTHGSILLEVAKREVHSTTALRQPNRLCPTRIGLLFYQHRNLHLAEHGRHEWRHRMDKKRAKKSATRRSSQKHCIPEDDEDMEDECDESIVKNSDKFFKLPPKSLPQSVNCTSQVLNSRFLASFEQYDSCMRD